MPYWWPAVVFGWPPIILSLALAVTGVALRKPKLGRVSAALALPFSYYLTGAANSIGPCRSCHAGRAGRERICSSPQCTAGGLGLTCCTDVDLDPAVFKCLVFMRESRLTTRLSRNPLARRFSHGC